MKIFCCNFCKFESLINEQSILYQQIGFLTFLAFHRDLRDEGRAIVAHPVGGWRRFLRKMARFNIVP